MSLESQLGALKLTALPPARYVTVPASLSVRAALERMREERLETLVILEGEALGGLVTPAGVRTRVLGRPEAWEGPVSGVMESVEPVTPATTLQEAMRRLESHPFLPLVEQGRVLSVLSRAGLLRHLHGSLGTLKFNTAPGQERPLVKGAR